jgi:uncharacterized protein
MDLRGVLEEVLQIKGITSVAVISDEGFVIESAVSEGTVIDLDFLGGVASSSLAAGQALSEFFGKGEVNQTMIEYTEGPVLLTPLRDGDTAVSLLATLDSTQNLGRVRFQLKRHFPKVIEAVRA